MLKKGATQLTLLILIYGILGAIFLENFRYQLFADEISYISIAQKYLAGNFTDAVNGYWSPMESWLLVPFLSFGIDPLLAKLLLSILVGGITLVGIRHLSRNFEMTREIRQWVMVASMPMVLYFAFSFVAADLLLVCFLICYFNIIFHPDYSKRLRNAAWCGCLGAAAYLTKSYALPFFIAHFVVFNLLQYFASVSRVDKNGVLRNALLGLTVFAMLCAPWISIISLKYQHPVFSTVRPVVLLGHRGLDLPMSYQGLLKPPNESAVNIWEDPTYLEIEEWSPSLSRELIGNELGFFFRNWISIYHHLSDISVLTATIVIGCLLYSVVPMRKFLKLRIHYPLITFALYAFGYSLLYVQQRYLWVEGVLLLLMGGTILHLLVQSGIIAGRREFAAVLIFALSFMILPAKRLLLTRHPDRDTAITAELLHSRYGIGGNIASHRAINTDWLSSPAKTYWTSWHKTLRIAYHLGGHYYGTPQQDLSGDEILSELHAHHIDYYFVWDGAEVPFLWAYQEKTRDEIPNLKVYAVHERLVQPHRGDVGETKS